MHVDILSLFPSFFDSPFAVSILKRALEKGLISINQINIRDFSSDMKHKKVDERPFGGGPGMVLAAQPVVDAIRSVKKENSHVIYLSPQGHLLTAKRCQELSKLPHLILLCGHYEGIDQRALDKEVDEELSIGDYVLTNGCIAANVLIDAVSRFIEGVLGDPESSLKDSFQKSMLFEGPQYTRPEIFEDMAVPHVLLNGNHAEIARWKHKMGYEKTKDVRPDLFEKYLEEAKN